MLNWKNVISLVISEGVVQKITCADGVLWEKPVPWEPPVQIGDVLILTQVYSAGQTGSVVSII